MQTDVKLRIHSLARRQQPIGLRIMKVVSHQDVEGALDPAEDGVFLAKQ